MTTMKMDGAIVVYHYMPYYKSRFGEKKKKWRGEKISVADTVLLTSVKNDSILMRGAKRGWQLAIIGLSLACQIRYDGINKWRGFNCHITSKE